MIGIASKVIVVARDKYGNAAWHLEDPWEVVLSSAASPDQAMPTRFESVGNGNHTVKYELPAVGLYQMSVQLQGQHVTGSPLEITALDLQHGGDLVPENSIAEMPLFLDGEAVAGEPMHVNLYLRDHDCFPGRLGSEPTSFVLQLRHADTDGAAMELNLTTGEVAGDNAGALRGTAYPDIAGVFDAMVGVRIGSADLAYLAPQEGRAWPVQLEVVPSSPSSQESSIAISSIRPDDKGHFIAEAGTTLELNVTLRDDFGNVLKPGHFPALLPKMVLHTAENPTADFYAQSEYGAVGNGTAAVNVTRAGAVLLVLRLDGKPLASADLTVIGGPAAKGLATATGNTTSALPFEEASITLQMRDVFGNKAAFPPGLQCSATVAVAEDAGGSAPGPFATNSSARCLEGHSAGSVEIRYTLAAKEGSFNLSIRLLANEGWGDHYQLPVVVAGDAIISHAGALLQDSDVLDSPGIDPLGAGHQLGAGSPATDRSFIPGLGAGSAVAVVASAAAGFVVLSAILCLWAIRRRSKDDIDLLTRRLLPKPGLVSRTSIMPDEEAPTAEKLMGPGDGGRPAAGVKVAGPRRPSYFQDMSRESEANGDESPVEAGSNAAARGPKPRKGEEGSAESKAADGRRGSSLLVSFGQELQDVLAIELPTSMPRRSELPEPEDPTGPAYILSQAQREDAEREEMACGTINAKPPRPAASLSSPVRQSRVLVRGDSASDSRTGKTLAMYPEGLAEPKGDRLIPADSKSGAREDVGLEGSEDAPSSQSDEELDPGPRLSVESLAQSQRSSGALSAILAAAQRAFQHHRPPAGEQGGESEQPAPQGGKQADAARQDHPGQLFSPDPVPLTDCRPQGHRGMAKLPPVDLLAQRRQQAEAPGRLASALRASMQSMGLSSWDGMRRDAVTIVPSSIASPNRLSPLGEGPKQTRLPSLKGSEGAQLPFLGGRGADGLVSNEPASPRALGHQPRAARPLDELPSPDGGSPYPDLGHPQHLLARESDPEIGPLRYPEARDSLQSPDQRADAPGGGRPGQPSPLDSPAGSGGSDGSHPPASPASSAGVLWDILSGAEASSLPFAPTSSRPPRSPSSSYSSSQHSEHQVLLDPAELESSLIVASTGFPPGLLTPESPSEPTQWPSAAQGSAPTLAGSQTTPRDGDGPHPPPLPPWRRPSTRAGVLESLSAAQPPQRRFSNSSNKWGHTHVQPSDDGSRPSDEPPVRLQKTRGTWDGAL